MYGFFGIEIKVRGYPTTYIDKILIYYTPLQLTTNHCVQYSEECIVGYQNEINLR